MDSNTLEKLLNPKTLLELFPKNRSDDFFEALFGDVSEGAYDIALAYGGINGNTLTMELQLHERPGCCLVCNLTQGLPQVFSRHPIINVKGVVEQIDTLLGDNGSCDDWSLGHTEQRQKSIHIIPIHISIS